MNYRSQLILQFVWILIVGALFIFIADKRIAGVIAAIGFFLIPIIMIETERRKPGKKSPLQIAQMGSALAFLFFASLPIFFLRVLNWNTEFSQLQLFGIPADSIHAFSNFLYSVMISMTMFAGRKVDRWWT